MVIVFTSLQLQSPASRNPLLLGHAAPDSVGLPGPQGERQAFTPYWAARADGFRPGDLLQAGA
jgi:hypothetical protein